MRNVNTFRIFRWVLVVAAYAIAFAALLGAIVLFKTSFYW